MGLPAILTPQSLEDLQEIVAFIARDNPERARPFGNELINKALSLSPFPDCGRVVPEFADPGVREIIHGANRIIYERVADAVYVLRFWHGARGEPAVKRG